MNYEWSKKQKRIFDLKKFKNDKIIVRACPGSGKTTCVSKRIANFIQKHDYKQQGLSILSFTNIAIDEIKRNYNEITHSEIKYPHYIGTIDSFINTYIFLPYGHLVMECKKRPILVGEPYSTWTHYKYDYHYFDKLSYDLNGNIIKLSNKVPNNKEIIQSKKILNKKGFATQEDSNYFSMKILKEYPQIAEIIVTKFPYFIIDEAQDMSKIQMELLDTLIQNNLKNVFLLGDPNQAIFEWKTAEPSLFDKKYDKWKALKLNETYRCSDNICKYLSKLSNEKIISKLNNDIHYKPTIISNEKKYDDIKKDFLKKIEKNNINKKDSAILFRSNKDFNMQIDQIEKIDIKDIFKDNKNDIKLFKKHIKLNYKLPNKEKIRSYSENIIKGSYFLLNNCFNQSFHEFEIAFLKILSKKTNNYYNEKTKIIKKYGFHEYKIKIFNFMNSFEKIDNITQLIDDWVEINNNKLIKVENYIVYLNKIKTKNKISNIKLNKKLTWKMLDNNYSQKDDNIFIGTIHSAKGRTFDAVLLILNSNCTKLLGKKELYEEEELRNVYVGMSRARNILDIVVPKNDEKIWKNFFEKNDKQYKLENFI